MFDSVNHPKHYNSHPSGVEAIQVAEHMNFCLGNVLKYIWRSDHKNGLEDLRKAYWYLNREIERREKQERKERRKKKRKRQQAPAVWVPFDVGSDE